MLWNAKKRFARTGNCGRGAWTGGPNTLWLALHPHIYIQCVEKIGAWIDSGTIYGRHQIPQRFFVDWQFWNSQNIALNEASVAQSGHLFKCTRFGTLWWKGWISWVITHTVLEFYPTRYKPTRKRLNSLMESRHDIGHWGLVVDVAVDVQALGAVW